MKSRLIPSLCLVFAMIAFANLGVLQAADQAAPAAADTASKNLLKPANDPDSWTFELNEGGDGRMEVEGDAIVFHVTKSTGTNWHVQAYQSLELKEGQTYVLKFKMKAVDSTVVLVMAGINEEDWHEIGLHEEISPSKEFEDYEYTFTASEVSKNSNRIGFVLGASNGIVTIKDLTLTSK